MSVFVGKLGVRWYRRAVSPGLVPSLVEHIGWKHADCDPPSMSELLQPTKMQAERQQEHLQSSPWGILFNLVLCLLVYISVMTDSVPQLLGQEGGMPVPNNP